ncbi:MAG: MucB/RseB C-terminal domain-containing protein [Gammaproteobacteria bacterium]|nr:MucB/RseB C-terminal domain-containing protein [Gammaproteobacteria bacterium]
MRPRAYRSGVVVSGTLLLLAMLAGPANADDPGAWLDRMHAALAELSYHGEFSYFHGGELASLSIAHAVVDGVRRERLVHLNGMPREVVRHGDKVTCVLHPGDRLIDLEQSVPAGPFAQSYGRVLDGLPQGYQATLVGEDRIAGRTAVQLRIEPEMPDRYGYRLWLDRETALLLRSELLDTSDQPLEIFQFVRIEIGGPIAARKLEVSEGDHLVKHELLKRDPVRRDPARRDRASQGRAASAETGSDRLQAVGPFALDSSSVTTDDDTVEWEAGWLPAGFAMSSADIRRVPSRSDSIANLVYSDGMATFSVFVERAPADLSPVHVARHGATVAVMRRVSAATPEPWLVTVVGEVPVETAERVAENVRPLAAAGD